MPPPYMSEPAAPRRNTRSIVQWVTTILAVLVALVSYRYVLDLPPIPAGIAQNRFRIGWLALHAGFAATALLTGTVQFSAALRQRRPAIHRTVGRVYAVSCLIGAIAGFVLALGTRAGSIAMVGFGGLAVAWAVITAMGWQHARAGRFASHRRWMIRSWALTLSAVTLRVYLPLSELAGFSEMSAYRAISFVAWVPNLLVAEALLRRRP